MDTPVQWKERWSSDVPTGPASRMIIIITCRLSLLMLTTILDSSHRTLRPTLGPRWCSSGSRPPHGRSSRWEGRGRDGGKGKGRLERREEASGRERGSELRRMDSSGGNMLSRGSTGSVGHMGWMRPSPRHHHRTRERQD